MVKDDGCDRQKNKQTTYSCWWFKVNFEVQHICGRFLRVVYHYLIVLVQQTTRIKSTKQKNIIQNLPR